MSTLWQKIANSVVVLIRWAKQFWDTGSRARRTRRRWCKADGIILKLTVIVSANCMMLLWLNRRLETGEWPGRRLTLWLNRRLETGEWFGRRLTWCRQSWQVTPLGWWQEACGVTRHGRHSTVDCWTNSTVLAVDNNNFQYKNKSNQATHVNKQVWKQYQFNVWHSQNFYISNL